MAKSRIKVSTVKAVPLLETAISSLPEEEIRDPVVPVTTLISEASSLEAAARKDRKELLAVGMEPTLIKLLEDSKIALSKAQGEWNIVNTQKRSEAEIALTEKASAIRSDMIAEVRFAVPKSEVVERTIAEIGEVESTADLIQDIRTLSVLFGQHEKELQKIGVVAKERSEKANTIAKELETMISKRRGGLETSSPIKRHRDLLATVLFKTMQEVRRTGLFVFRHSPDRRKHYVSEYRKRSSNTGEAPVAPKPIDESLPK